MNTKKMMPAYFAVAFVWFTTHFGGGFASGAQVVQYFVAYGWYAAFLPIVSQALLAVIFYYAWKFALDKKKYDYKSWTLEFYKPVEKVMSPIFEIIYQLLLITGTAIAFATGGATITAVFGTSYIINTIVIAVGMLILTIFGAKLVRDAASVMAIAIIVGMLVVYVPNVIASWGDITANIAALKSGAIVNDASFGSALWKTLMYAGFQAAALGAYLAHSNALKDVNEAKKAAIWGFVLNASILGISTLGIMGFYKDGILKETVPALFVVMHGVGSSWMTPLISILVILGSISTGVNLIFGITSRVVTFLARNDTDAIKIEKETKRSALVSLGYVVFTWCVAQFGLIPLIAKGYGTIGYISIFVIILPLLIKGIIGWKPVNKDKDIAL
ncbi:hypothetical protein G9F71_009515 [Clostridium sp. FP2]|uniref:YkvI family membrane protein n=1 Tax=Clostridium TaxID=1485 RepID=UPI0013E94131|nr:MULTISPECIES: hypothetical protein [Clostridium]MBW9157122.1 hypothetical protein [Clostridium tagluense]MBZ9623093.1 hypothetical protein [Clostridium sp. FP2]WLC67270.1 hypothetical protein KTC93_08865 [Clostridium tagluense]